MFTSTLGPIAFPGCIAELLNTHEFYANLIRELLIKTRWYVGEKALKILWLEYMIKEQLMHSLKKN